MATAMTSLTAAIASTSSKRIDPAHPDLTAPQDHLDEDGDVFQVRLPAQVGSDGFEIGPLRASDSRRSKSARRVSRRYAVRRTRLLPMALRGCLVRHSPGVVLVHRLKAWLKALTSE